VDHASRLVTAHFVISVGALARLGHVRAEPANVFRPNFVARLRNWTPGQTYTPDRLARVRRALSETGAVANVSTQMHPPGPDGPRDVVLAVEPAKRNAYEFGLGYSTTEGAGIDAQWTRRNLTGRADALTIAATLGEKTQNFGIQLTRPDAAGLGRAQN